MKQQSRDVYHSPEHHERIHVSSWLQLRIKHRDLNLAQLQASVLISTLQPCFQGVEPLWSWLHFRAHFCRLPCAKAPLTHPARTLLPPLPNHISVALLMLSLYLAWPQSRTQGTFHRFHALRVKFLTHWRVRSISFHPPILEHSCLIQHAPNFTYWTEKRGSSSLFTKKDSYIF